MCFRMHSGCGKDLTSFGLIWFGWWQVVRLCREHGLYSALIYLFNRGLDDFRSPLEELLTVADQASNPSQTQLIGFVSTLSLTDHIFLGCFFAFSCTRQFLALSS